MLNKDRDHTEKLTSSDKCNPLYDRKRFREYLQGKSGQKLFSNYQGATADNLLKEMKKESNNLLYRGDKVKTEQQMQAEHELMVEKIIREEERNNGSDEDYASQETAFAENGKAAQINVTQLIKPTTGTTTSEDTQSMKSILKHSTALDIKSSSKQRFKK